MAKRALLLVIIFMTLFSLGLGVVSAQDDDDDSNPNNGAWEYTGDRALIEQYTAATERCDTPSLECLVYYTVNYTAIELTNSIVPINPGNLGNGNSAPETDPDADEATDAYSGPTIAGKQGLLPGISYLISQMYVNPAASTHTYVADVLDSAGVAVAQPAYAQGLGFVALNPILDLWKTFRNIAYIFYVLMFVIIGFLIMFRQKVGQQAITAQQAIPSIIISLLFVTFSYAIAGFLIDLMYLSMFLIVGFFQSNSEVISYNILQLGAEFIGRGFSAGQGVGENIVETMMVEAFNLNGENLISGTFGWIGGITIGLVVAVAVLIATFKLFFELLKSYATIVLMIVTAPVQLMMGAIPGRNVVSGWIKNIVGNLSVFPVVLMAFIMFRIFTDNASGIGAGGFMPPFLVGRGAPNAITSIMGLAILLAIPEIVKKVKEAFGATGGFGEVIAGAAWDRAQAGWRGDGVPGGWGAKKIMGTGVKAGAYTAGSAALGVGAGAGYALWKRRQDEETRKKLPSAWKVGAGAAVTPAALKVGLPIARKGAEVADRVVKYTRLYPAANEFLAAQLASRARTEDPSPEEKQREQENKDMPGSDRSGI